MFGWLRNLGKSADWRKSEYPARELAWLHADFLRLAPLNASLPDLAMDFVAAGQHPEVLCLLAGTQGAAKALGLRCDSQTWSNNSIIDRDKFFVETTILDPALHLRLALVYDAAAQSGQRRSSCAGLANGGEWLEVYMWEATRTASNIYPRQPKATRLDASVLEDMLDLHGNPRSWLVRGALLLDTTQHWWGNNFTELFLKVPGVRESFTRHVDTVRECLDQSDHRGRIHAIQAVHRVGGSPSLCPDLVASLAVDSSKLVREAALAWIVTGPDVVVPELQRIAASGGPEERAHAVKLLGRLGGESMRPFLEQRLSVEKAKKVVELLEGLLRSEVPSPGKRDSGAAHAPALPELAPLPNELPDTSLAHSVLDDLKKVIEKANTAWLTVWTAHKGQRWSAKHPPQLPLSAAAEWFELLQSLKVGFKARNNPSLEHSRSRNGWEALAKFTAHPGFNLVHVLRWCLLLDHEFPTRTGFWHGTVRPCLDARIEGRGPIEFRELAHICFLLGIPSEWIGEWWLDAGKNLGGGFAESSPEITWTYFAERLDALGKALGWIPTGPVDRMSTYLDGTRRENAWRALSGFPTPPPTLVDRIWEVALGSSKTERHLAQAALLRDPNRDSRIIAALSSGQQEQRAIAADWLGRLRVEAAVPVIRKAVVKEKYDVPKAAMLTALERLGVPPDEFLDRAGLLKDATRLAAKGTPPVLAWFPFDQLPAVHWADSGRRVDPEILKSWLIQACRLKSPEPSPLLRRYAAGFKSAERENLGQFILQAWLSEDVMPRPREEAEKAAMQQAQQYVQLAVQYPKYYPQKTLEEFYAQFLPGFLAQPKGSANESKGILAVAGACAGAGAAQPISQYLKKWYGTRVHQARALLQMLAWVDHESATQTLLAIGTRFRTKSLQEEATRLAQSIAERKGWSLAELADRTIPSAGLDEDGVLELDYGPRLFTARLDADMGLVLFDPDGKPIKALPDPRKDDDPELAAAAKKQIAASRKEVKQVLEQQRMNLYEAMCVQRSWRYEDWELFLNRHPLVRHICRRLVWQAGNGDAAPVWFRPLEDFSLTNVEDNPVTLGPNDSVRLAHASAMTEVAARQWVQHLNDYNVAPLFDQFGRTMPAVSADKAKQLELKDFEGWLVETFKLRTRGNKLGYTRGGAQDGGWFTDYIKRFPTLGIEAVVEFTGNPLPEENRTAALLKLYFRRADSGWGAEVPLEKVPPVLLTECWNDFRLMAAEGPGFDAEWQNKSQY